MDKFTVRGIIYSTISGLGLGYELFFIHPARLFLVVMYSLVIGIGMILIFVINDNDKV